MEPSRTDARRMQLGAPTAQFGIALNDRSNRQTPLLTFRPWKRPWFTGVAAPDVQVCHVSSIPVTFTALGLAWRLGDFHPFTRFETRTGGRACQELFAVDAADEFDLYSRPDRRRI